MPSCFNLQHQAGETHGVIKRAPAPAITAVGIRILIEQIFYEGQLPFR